MRPQQLPVAWEHICLPSFLPSPGTKPSISSSAVEGLQAETTEPEHLASHVGSTSPGSASSTVKKKKRKEKTTIIIVLPHGLVGIKCNNICKGPEKCLAHSECCVCVHCYFFKGINIGYWCQKESRGTTSFNTGFLFVLLLLLLLFTGKKPEKIKSLLKMCPH